jgi:hypothetical protein
VIVEVRNLFICLMRYITHNPKTYQGDAHKEK